MLKYQRKIAGYRRLFSILFALTLSLFVQRVQYFFGVERRTESTYMFYILLSRKAASCDLETAPTLVASTLPFLNNIRVGMPRMP